MMGLLHSWIFLIAVEKVKDSSSVCKFVPAGERLMIQRQTVVAIATQTLSTSCPSEAAVHNEGPSVTGC